MKTIVVRDIYTVDTISKTNDKAWKTLLGILNNENEDILFDFKGIEVIEPWGNDEFKRFLGNEHAYMKLYSSKKTVDTIDMAAILGGMKPGRFFNEDIIAPPTLTKEDKTAMRMAEQLQEYFITTTGENQDTAVFEIYKRFDQIGSINTVDYIEKAVLKFSNEKGIKNIIIGTSAIFIQKNILELLANVIGRAYSQGINLNIMSTDKDVMSKIGLYQHLASNKTLTLQAKYNIAKQIISEKTVGMLTKYKKSKAVDEFGRHGNGEPVSCRVAIFNGFTRNQGGIPSMKFNTYNGNSFYTQEHWTLEHDGEQLEKLESENIIIPLNEIGLFDKFLGSKYHFLMPIQYDEADFSTIYSIDQDGKMVYTKATIPMRIKAVLDDWKVEYDESSLVHSITETERIIQKINK